METARLPAATLPRSFQFSSTHDKPSTPFKATLLWEKIVLHLEMSIKCGRHSHGLKIYDNCFRGGRAVACLSIYLNKVLPKTVSREQVLTLCNKLVMTGVLEDVRDEDSNIFKESRLYRFSNYHFWETPPTENITSSTPNILSENPSPGNQHRSVGDIRKEISRIGISGMDSIRQMPLLASVAYTSDSLPGHMNRSGHAKHPCPRESSPLRHFQGSLDDLNLKGRVQESCLVSSTNEKLKKAISCTIGEQKHFRADLQLDKAHETVKLSRKNAMKRESRPQRCGTTAAAKRSQSQSYGVKETARRTCVCSRKLVHDELTDMACPERVTKSVRVKQSKRTTEKENDHVVRSYCIESNPEYGNRAKLLFVNNIVCVIPERKSQAPVAPSGTNWVVYGYL